MGEVRCATRNGSDNEVAVKVLRPELVDDPILIARFLQERDVLCSLDHPNLVRVRDLIVEGGSAAIVMDLVDGSDLRRELVRVGTLSPEDAATLVIEVLNALRAVHEIGVVHRDVKPENLLLGSDGEVRLTDFGIAKLAEGTIPTQLDGYVGTPDYLAPELATHDHATPAADVYSTGVVFYELLTGHTPFGGGHPIAVLRRHIEVPVPRPEGLPDPLWRLLAAMLEKEPADRPSAADAAKRITKMLPALKGLPPLKPTLPPRNLDESPTTLRLRTTSQDEPSPLVGVSRWTSGVVPDQARHRLLVPAVVAAVVIAVVAVGVGIVLTSSKSNKPPVTYAFKPQSFTSGIILDRTWQLSGSSDHVLQARVVLTNGTSSAVKTSYYEVIPNTVAPSVNDIAFSPTPDQVIRADPIVRYDVKLAAGASERITYTANLPSTNQSPGARLASLAESQITDQKAYLQSANKPAPVTLATLTLSPTSLILKIGESETISVSGTMSNGKPANPALLAFVLWSSDHPLVATVSGGVVTGDSAGGAVITVQGGDLTARATVGVLASTTTSTGSTTTLPVGNTGSGILPANGNTGSGNTYTTYGNTGSGNTYTTYGNTGSGNTGYAGSGNTGSGSTGSGNSGTNPGNGNTGYWNSTTTIP